MTDASNTAVGAVLQQFVNDSWQPLGFYSSKLSDTQQKYSAYDRELLAIYMAIKHFRNQIEGRQLTIYTDHKPITYAFAKIGTDSETPRRTRQLLFISEFTTDIRHVSGEGNAVADALSRVDAITCPTTINFEELSAAQSDDATLTHLLQDTDSSAKLKRIFLPSGQTSIVCDLTSKNARPYLPEKFRKLTFDYIHNMSHPGIRTSRKLMSERYFWPNMNRDVGNWAKSCIQCQRAKVQRHVISDLGRFSPSERFGHIHVDIVGPLPTTTDDYKYLLTIIDRCTGWPEAFPMKDISADSVAKVILEGWIARYGCPSKLTSDQGKQFESNLFIN
ncbi:Transposon Tf2-8 polyprotein [Eumeta japonica]|uniref:RNA-directed DNA polymerase n=1 Tax=Eumeta variegata TaxID=151549 RepID=A0A4C1XSL1_EUMVA|nr:Transposon Tf2-8 polyprotein [Eumeta japonica]